MKRRSWAVPVRGDSHVPAPQVTPGTPPCVCASPATISPSPVPPSLPLVLLWQVLLLPQQKEGSSPGSLLTRSDGEQSVAEIMKLFGEAGRAV